MEHNRLLYSAFVIIVTGLTIYFMGVTELHDKRHMIHYILAIMWGILLLVTLTVDKYKEKKNKIHLFIDASAVYFILFHLVYSFHIQHGSKSIYDFF